MKPSSLLFVVLLAASCVVSCRQGDGPMPVAEGDVPDRLNDLSHDLLNVAARVPDARREFADDLVVFAQGKAAQAAVTSLANRVSDAVEQAKLTESSSRELARALWVVVAGTELSPRQIETARDDLRGQLTAAGASPERSTAVASEVDKVQSAVNTRPRQWYEVF